MSRKIALALLSVVALLAALLAPAAVAGEGGRACTDIVGGGGTYDPDDAVPLVSEDTGPNGWLRQFSIDLRDAPCKGIAYTMYVMDEKSDLDTAPHGHPNFDPLVEIVRTHEAALQDSLTGSYYLEYADPDVRILDDDGDICVFHAVIGPGGHVFDYGTPDSAPCQTLPAGAGANSYR